ncbi:iron complex outermembrane receptor protein [Rhizomicrobium palustre]|uniref:Iron complex outermembrane receptor protein n=1 Tax=Rhizomicrobium palustre TaxID=189966 RepID=A0A846MXW1_9PROT|nr:TonB-dependent receptor [Rhizomicrobium palustre]NIK88216.1 iron complex outermembrane receptor protein [Rhizomicrobium palustre]
MNFTGINTRRLLLGVAGVAILSSMPAVAQIKDAGLEQVVVTAERRSENQQSVPVSVSVLNSEALDTFTASGDDTLLALSGKVPDLYIESTTGRIFPRFYIRGLGNVDFYLGASQPVSIIQDDIVMEHVVLKSTPIFDVGQIEVFRGPQGSLFGRNTTAGIIKFDSIRPSQTLQARASASYGAYNTVDLDAGIGGPIVPGKLAIRVSGLYQSRADYIDNTYSGPSADGTVTGQKNATGGYNERDLRVQLLFTPTDSLTMLTSMHGRWYDGPASVFRRGAIKLGSHNVDGEHWNKARWDEAANNPQGYNTYGISENIAYDFGGVTLTSITGYESTNGQSRGDTDGGAAADFGNMGFGESMGRVRALGQWSEELRLASANEGKFKWQVGGLYFDQHDITEFYQRAFFLTPPANNPNNWVRLRDANTSWALFGQASYEVLPDLTLTGGVRVTNDKKDTLLLKTANTAAGVVTFPATANRNPVLESTKPSWDISALYTLSDDVSLYARVATGFRGPTIQGRSAVFNSPFTMANSETILSWEAGMKTQLSNTLRFNLSGFTYTVDDIQLNANDSNGNGVFFNAKKAEAYGLEAQLDWLPIENLSLTAGLSLLHTEIKDSTAFAQMGSFAGALTLTPLNPYFTKGSGTGTTYFAKIDGNPLPNAPEYNLNFSARYDLPVSSLGGNLFVATDWNLQGYTNFVLYRSKEFNSNGNFEGGAKIGYSTDAYEVAFYGRNITNNKNLKGVIENYDAAILNEPATYGITLSAKLQ